MQAVHHRHNVSAILRTCDALGVHHVDLVEGHFVATKGAARGAERWLDIHHHTSVSDGLQAIRAAGYSIWVAGLTETSVPPSEVPIDRPICLWFGAELVGVDPEAAAAADGVVHIPMRGLAQSLNVSVAAAITLSTVVERARGAHGESAKLPAAERDAVWKAWIEREEALQAALRLRASQEFPSGA